MNNELSLKKVGVLLLLITAVIGIPLTVYLAQRQQQTQSKASVVSEETVVAVIDGQQITKADVRRVAEEQNDPTVVDSQALKNALQTIEERKILDKAAKDLGIEVDSARVDELVAQEFSDLDARYEVLRDQVILKVVKSREALSVEFWNPPTTSLSSLTADEKATAAKELADGIPALTQAETKMKAGDSVLDIGDALLTKYPKLAPVLAVNGYILTSLSEAERAAAARPQVYEFGDSALDQTTLNALFAMNLDELKTITNTEANRGGSVFKLISKGKDDGAKSYDSWLSAQKKSLVVNLNLL